MSTSSKAAITLLGGNSARRSGRHERAERGKRLVPARHQVGTTGGEREASGCVASRASRQADAGVGGCGLGRRCQLVARPTFQVASSKTLQKREALQPGQDGVARGEATEEGACRSHLPRRCGFGTRLRRERPREAKTCQRGTTTSLQAAAIESSPSGRPSHDLKGRNSLGAGEEAVAASSPPERFKRPDRAGANPPASQQPARPVWQALPVATTPRNDLTRSRITL